MEILKKMKSKTWAVIPAMNEASRIKPVLKKTKRHIDNLIVVDDGSDDNTGKIARDEKAIVLRHRVNMGKGAALKTGCDYAISKGAERIVVLDSDGQHDPEEIPEFLKSLEDTDIVFGKRRFNNQMPSLMRFGNSFINLMTRLLYGMRLSDTQSGYRAFTADAYRKIRWKASDYSMESEMIANSGKHGLRYKEIPIKTIYSDRYKGTTALDGISIVWDMIWWRILK